MNNEEPQSIDEVVHTIENHYTDAYESLLYNLYTMYSQAYYDHKSSLPDYHNLREITAEIADQTIEMLQVLNCLDSSCTDYKDIKVLCDKSMKYYDAFSKLLTLYGTTYSKHHTSKRGTHNDKISKK